MALPLVAPISMANPYRLSKRTRLLLWLLSKRPEVDAVNLLPTYQHLGNLWITRPAMAP